MDAEAPLRRDAGLHAARRHAWARHDAAHGDGEHVDYNQGIVLPAAIDRFVRLAAHPRSDRLVSIRALDFDGEVVFSLDGLEQRADIDGQPLPQWALYPAGVAWSLQAGGLPLSGMDAVYASDLPIGAGLSSSAAVELAFAVAWQFRSAAPPAAGHPDLSEAAVRALSTGQKVVE